MDTILNQHPEIIEMVKDDITKGKEERKEEFKKQLKLLRSSINQAERSWQHRCQRP